MLLYNRRSVLASLTAIALTECGLTPVYSPQGSAIMLLNQVILAPPKNYNDYLLHQHIEERIGPPSSSRWRLTTELSTKIVGLGYTRDGKITRYNIDGTVNYTLRRTNSKTVFKSGKVQHFTSYSASGTTVATLAAKRDASVRLMTILADQIIDQLLLIGENLQA